MKKQYTLEGRFTELIADKIVMINRLIIKAENEEKYEAAGKLFKSLNDIIYNEAKRLSQNPNNSTTFNQAMNKLKEQSGYVRNALLE